MTRVAMIKAEIEGHLIEMKHDIRMYEADFKAKKRLEATKNNKMFKIDVGGETAEVKITEKALEACFETDKGWRKLMSDMIRFESRLRKVEGLSWGVISKDKKLNTMIMGATPQQVEEGAIGGMINGVMVTK